MPSPIKGGLDQRLYAMLTLAERIAREGDADRG